MLVFRLILFASLFLAGKPHPFYLSVTDIKYNEKNRTLEVACKMFTNDLENVLKKNTGKKIDLIDPKDKKETEKVLFDYISKRLEINLNGKKQTLKFLGYEKEEDVIWTYMEIEKCEKPKQFVIHNSLLYDHLKEQINMVHLEVNNKKQSSKVTNPEKELKFTVN
jgi:hypothetical protein